MKNKGKKIILSSIAALTLVSVAITTVIIRTSDTANANVAFSGVKDIVASRTKEKPYNIIELVPDKSLAKLGYMIAGQEPIDWLDRISYMYNAPHTEAGVGVTVSRVDYVNNTLKELLKDITDTDINNSNPLHYEEYKEVYAVDYNEIDSWNILNLKGVEQIPANTSGYEMKEVGATNGDYIFQQEYVAHDELIQDINIKSYIQNINYYAYSGKGYYGLAFKNIQKDSDRNYVDLLGEDGGAYRVKSSHGFANQSMIDAYKVNNPHAAIYQLPIKNVGLPYEFVGYIDKLSTYDFDNFFYYAVNMEYIDAVNMDNNKTYYVPDDSQSRFFADETGEYSGVLVTEEPYIEATGSNLGHFTIDSSSELYTYVGKGQGSYQMYYDKDKVLDYPVNINFVYYKGGFSNNNWFKTGVFNQDGNTLNETTDIEIAVEVCTPDDLNKIDISTIDMIYINSSLSSISENKDSDSISTSFSAEEDILPETLNRIYTKVTMSGFYMPIIIDGSVTGKKVDNNSTNIDKLVALLSSSNKEELQITEETDLSNFDWNSLKYIDNASSYLAETGYGYVNGNIYVIPADNKEKKPFICDSFHNAFLARVEDSSVFLTNYKNIGFEEIANYINEENLIRENENNNGHLTEKYSYYDLDISRAIVIEYIVCYSNRRVMKMDSKLNVLDIEPCTVYQPSESGLKYSMIKSWLGDNCPPEEDVSITLMSSAEFIGRIEDLNNYDFIYFGLATDRWTKDSNNKVIHNDPNMGNMIYTNVGDLVIVNPNGLNGRPYMHSGLLNSDYILDDSGNRVSLNLSIDEAIMGNGMINGEAVNTYRASGNDLTLDKIKKLDEYIYGGYPIILCDDFYSDASQKSVNEEYIDNSSNIYDFLKKHIENNNQYVMSNKQVLNNTGLLYKYLTTDKPKIELFNMNKEEGKEYVKLESSVIDINFYIDNTHGVDINALFDVKLLLDTNSDGKFSNTREDISAQEIRVYKNGISIEPKYDEQTKQYYYQLPAGVENKYSISYTLPDAFIGIIPWKIKINQTNNEYRYDSVQGYFYRKGSRENKEKISILQITRDRDDYGNWVYYSSFNMQNELNDSNSLFHRLVVDLEDYDLNIKTIYAGDYELKYSELDENNPIRDAGKIYLEDYDMIVIGFGDMYHINNVNGCLDGIKEYIASGRPVLFTHDTTSIDNDSTNTFGDKEGKYRYGYDFNQLIRESVGLDRYGILHSPELKAIDKKIDIKTDPQKYELAVQYAKNNNKDLAYLPGSNREVITKHNQGFIYMDLNRYIYWDVKKPFNTLLYMEKSAENPYGIVRAATGRLGQDGVEDTKEYGPDGKLSTVDNDQLMVSQVNSGQITTYPYQLPEKFLINRTHMQYYQLDLNRDTDNDGESDIVVWYTLGDENSSSYNTSLKDVRNNYYIYTMGNVTYSGVGHSKISNNENELKLYINTMIAAYTSRYTGPKIYLKESDSPDSPVLKYFDIPYDTASYNYNIREDIEPATGPYTFYFSVNDTNIVKNLVNKTEYADFYIEVTAENYDKNNGVMINDGGIKYLKKVSCKVSRLNSEGVYEENKTKALDNGRLYKAEIPRQEVGVEDNTEVYCVAYTRIETEDGRVTKTTNSFESFRIARIKLQNLD